MTTPEISWFSALCDDDYEFLGVPNPDLQSSWDHCRDIVETADRNGFDNILLPSGYALGIDSIAFAGGVAPLLERMRLLVAVRCAELAFAFSLGFGTTVAEPALIAVADEAAIAAATEGFWTKGNQ